VPFIRLADLIVVPSGYLVDVFARFGLQARAIHTSPISMSSATGSASRFDPSS
jgi:hypothetical protein